MSPKFERILVTNDDGVHAPGIKVLEAIAHELSKDVWVVAPETEQSGAGHSLTLNRPLRYREIGPKKFFVNGTPTDCILMAIEEILGRDKLPTLVLSGVNRGINIAEDVSYSGTIAAAMEATILGVPAIALSAWDSPNMPINWKGPQELSASIIKKLVSIEWPGNTLMNVNFPSRPVQEIKGVRMVRNGKRPPYKTVIRSIDPRGNPYYWVGPVPDLPKVEIDTDLDAINNGYVSITPINIDFTHEAFLSQIKGHFE